MHSSEASDLETPTNQTLRLEEIIYSNCKSLQQSIAQYANQEGLI